MSPIRTAVHLHTDWSYDGSLTLDQLAEGLAKRKYRAALMTEHDRGFDQTRWTEYQTACRAASRDDLLLVPGIEYSDPENRVHILVWGEDIGFFGEGLETLDLLRMASEHDAVAVMAHPWRRGAWERFTPEWAEHLVGIELWNRKSDGFAPSEQAAELIARHELWPVASLDFHRPRQFFPLSMQLEAVNCDAESLIGAMRGGNGRAEIMGIRLDKLRSGFPKATLSGVERLRKTLAPTLRRIIGRG